MSTSKQVALVSRFVLLLNRERKYIGRYRVVLAIDGIVPMALAGDTNCLSMASSEHRLSAFTTLRGATIHRPSTLQRPSEERVDSNGVGFVTPAPLMSVGLLHGRGMSSPATTLPVFPMGAFLPSTFVDLPLTAALSGLRKYRMV